MFFGRYIAFLYQCGCKFVFDIKFGYSSSSSSSSSPLFVLLLLLFTLPFIKSLSVDAGVKDGIFDAAIVIGSPVRGFFPIRSGRNLMKKVPNLGILILLAGSVLADSSSCSVITSKKILYKFSLSFLVIPVFLCIASIKSGFRK